MPSSFASGFAPIVNSMVALAPRTVIDVGPGWGKYGLACREYLPHLTTLWAMEVPEGRLRSQECIYDVILEADVTNHCVVGDPWESFQLVLLIDILEHMTVEVGHSLMRAIDGSGAQMIVSTPRIFIPQHDEANPFEDHVSLWVPHDFVGFTIQRDLSTADSHIYLI